MCALSDNEDINLGLHQFVVCDTSPNNYCQSYSLNNDAIFNDASTVASGCYKAGSGVIALATFAMLFALLAIVALHTYTTFKRACGCACPVPRLFVALFSLLSLGLYVGVVTLWWVKCENKVSGLLWQTGRGDAAQGPGGLRPGYALVVAVICTVFAALGWTFATLRSFVAHGDDDDSAGGTTNKKSTYGGSSGASSPAHGNGSYGMEMSSPEGQKHGQTFGY